MWERVRERERESVCEREWESAWMWMCECLKKHSKRAQNFLSPLVTGDGFFLSSSSSSFTLSRNLFRLSSVFCKSDKMRGRAQDCWFERARFSLLAWQCCLVSQRVSFYCAIRKQCFNQHCCYSIKNPSNMLFRVLRGQPHVGHVDQSLMPTPIFVFPHWLLPHLADSAVLACECIYLCQSILKQSGHARSQFPNLPLCSSCCWMLENDSVATSLGSLKRREGVRGERESRVCLTVVCRTLKSEEFVLQVFPSVCVCHPSSNFHLLKQTLLWCELSFLKKDYSSFVWLKNLDSSPILLKSESFEDDRSSSWSSRRWPDRKVFVASSVCCR